jgi:Holliday junction resolvase-like predicted endonuclease
MGETPFDGGQPGEVAVKEILVQREPEIVGGNARVGGGITIDIIQKDTDRVNLLVREL